MKPIVSIIMGSTSDLPVMEKAAKLLDEMHVPFEMNALSAHRTPEAVEEFAKNAAGRGIKVHHCRCRHGCRTSRCHCCKYHIACYRCPPLKGSVLDGVDALLFYHPNASRNSCSYRSNQWSHECSYSGRTNASIE